MSAVAASEMNTTGTATKKVDALRCIIEQSPCRTKTIINFPKGHQIHKVKGTLLCPRGFRPTPDKKLQAQAQSGGYLVPVETFSPFGQHVLQYLHDHMRGVTPKVNRGFIVLNMNLQSFRHCAKGELTWGIEADAA